jgi:hypothetical protein
MILLDLAVVDVNESNILGLSVDSLGNPEGEKVELGAAVVEPIIGAQIESGAELFRRLS